MIKRFPPSSEFVIVVVPIHQLMEGLAIDWVGGPALFAIVKRSLLSDLLAFAASTFIPMLFKYMLKEVRAYREKKRVKPRAWVTPAILAAAINDCDASSTPSYLPSAASVHPVMHPVKPATLRVTFSAAIPSS
ncbi:hypothetical protein [Paenibacillus aquistagni]|uniref:hypothetical protein n=1 Tax=Paenibacillus aquistagni TaxID=1852522 RepID=UPI00145AF392|nr:hypothetical protein [Paenibacillus aquistagni]NMM52575.1 hypothetical protein [Paenibacillus aquistagni]